MGDIRDAANEAFRDYVSPGSDVPHEPEKSEIRALFGTVEDEVGALRLSQVEGVIGYESWSLLDAHATAGLEAGAVAKVYGADAGTHTDPVVGGTVANEGVYRWSASPAGWKRIGNLEVDDAAGQVELARKWAEEDEDVEVDTGAYSAKHHAAKADEARIAAEAAAAGASGYLDKISPSRLGDRYNQDPDDPLNAERLFTTGVAAPTTTGSSAMAAGSWLLLTDVVPTGPLVYFEYPSLNAGTVKLRRMTYDRLVQTVVDEITLAIVAGPNVFTMEDLLKDGEPWIWTEGNYLQINNTANAGRYIAGASNETEYIYVSGDVAVSHTLGTPVNPTRANKLQYKAQWASSPRATELSPTETPNLQSRTLGPSTPADANTVLPGRTSYHWPERDSMEGPERLWRVRMWPFAALNGVAGIYKPDAAGDSVTLDREFHVEGNGGALVTLHAGLDFPPDVHLYPGGHPSFYSASYDAGVQPVLRGSTQQGTHFLWKEDGPLRRTISRAQRDAMGTEASVRPMISWDFQRVRPAVGRRNLFKHVYTGASAIPRSMYQQGWAMSGSPAYARNSEVGLANNQLRWHAGVTTTGKRTAINGIWTIYCRAASAGEIATFRNRVSTLNTAGSIATVNTSTGVMGFRGPYAGGTTLPAAVGGALSKSPAWLLNNAHWLRIDLTKRGYIISLTVTDTETGDSEVITYDASVTGGMNTIGLCMGAPGLAAISGDWDVREVEFAPLTQNPRVGIFGDSITHGQGASSATTGFGYMLAAACRGQVAAVPGDTATQMLTSFREDLEAWRYDYVHILIGNNDTNMSNWERDLRRACDEAVAAGAIPILGTLALNSGSTNPHLVQNPIIRGLGYRYVDYARALSVGRDGVTRDAAKYTDTVHPNDTGYAAMLAEAQRSAPDLFALAA